MSTLVTPSAKSHERVTGRWIKDFEVQTKREWVVYYLKQIIGTPVPWLLWSYVCLAFLSRAGLEIAAWSCALLTLGYVIVDRFSSNKEFTFFTVGADLFLLGYVAVGIASASFSDSTAAGLEALGGVRWVLLLYALAYCWELFPGLNRLFMLMSVMAGVASVYALWQHFTGVDLIRGVALPEAPAPGQIYFVPSGFFGTPEVLGTLLAMVIPFPAAAFIVDQRRYHRGDRWFALALCLLLVVALFWTYRPGIWVSAVGGLFVTILLAPKRGFQFLFIIAAAVAALLFGTYTDPQVTLDKVQQAEWTRGDAQRAQINTQVELWKNTEKPESIWVGVGQKARSVSNYDPSTNNVYFQILAEGGVLGAIFYMLFLLGFLLTTYRAFLEIPRTHHWHRVLVGGALASQIAFHVAGLFWSTHTETLVLYVFVLVIASVSYLIEHYSRGLVPDDHSL